jgi:hypothetical protein
MNTWLRSWPPKRKLAQRSGQSVVDLIDVRAVVEIEQATDGDSPAGRGGG